MDTNQNSLRNKLFSSYLVSLIVLAVFFYLGVHIFAFPYSTELFLLLLFVLAIIGFFTIRTITSSLTRLSGQIRLISSRNLDRHITGIKTDDEIGEVARTFNELLDRLNEAFKREQQFIADVAHELKTPLATQRSTMEIVISQNRTKEEYKEALEDALLDNNHISSTLKNVLDLAWAETPNEQSNASKFNLSTLMEDLYDIAIKMALSKKLIIQPTIKQDIHMVGFKDKLARGLLNIIDNAVKYTPSEGKIKINLNTTKTHAVITVADTGQGINKKDIPYIFDRFYRGSDTDNVLGSGLGLAITKSIVTLHKGEIKVKSELTKGSLFSIYLPLMS